MNFEGYFFQFLIIFLLILVNAFFVGAEFAIVRLRATELETYITKGDPKAKLAKYILDNIDKFISATQLGITIANLILGWLGEDVFSRMLAPVLDQFGIQSRFVHSLSIVA